MVFDRECDSMRISCDQICSYFSSSPHPTLVIVQDLVVLVVAVAFERRDLKGPLLSSQLG